MVDRLPYSISVAEAAIDLENYIAGRSTDLGSVRDLTEILKQHQLKETDPIDAHLFTNFYEPLWHAMMKNRNRRGITEEIVYTSKLVSETKDLILKLDDIEKNPDTKTLREIVTFLSDYSTELMRLEQQTYRYRLVA